MAEAAEVWVRLRVLAQVREQARARVLVRVPVSVRARLRNR
jgi:hypothetical protein